ncbi:hypothetical protein L0P88_22415 [Muricauda sp. SCSIO 64092]|uniref:hypothetical protein n=1 Tax=Allomuricauda sp. SCSIO 64092 TaxID=2908842 RepID=UPI001FF47F39|nr:hypothetical protein [Muricauda sp. SCSIO 64092]UOY06663.1 hypothetical protein L0P88_22415 [Muricauda sp. SCSIO 64092]
MKNILITLILGLITYNSFGQWSNTSDNVTQGAVNLRTYLLFDADGDFTGGNYFTIQDDPTDNYLRMGYGFNNHLSINSSGRIGIGTNNPSASLDVNGNAFFSGRADLFSGTIIGPKQNLNGKLWIDRHATQGKTFFTPYDDGAWQWEREFGYDHTHNSWYVSSSFGIGTTNTKGYKLGVKGKIAAEEVKVSLYNGWSDFVFGKDYYLPTLEEVENHIKEKGHLKDIPSAKEVAKNGVLLGEMNSKLLQKIEELTLYLIEQNKRNKEQQERIEKLEKLNSELLKKFRNQ